MTEFEPTASCSQSRRDTNFAIPGYSISAMIPRRVIKIKIFLSVVIPVVKAAFAPRLAAGGKSRKCRRRKALRRFTLPRPGYRHGTPKAGALHLDIQFPDIMVRQRRKLRKLNSELCSHRLSAPRSQIKAAPSITAHWSIRSGTLLDQSTS